MKRQPAVLQSPIALRLAPFALLRPGFALPGVVFHEVAHVLCCWAVGVEVRRFVPFQLGTPAGYVVHTQPRRLRHQALITWGPLPFNSAVALLLFAALAIEGRRWVADPAAWPQSLTLSVVAVWFGLSAAVHALPSRADAHCLWDSARGQLRRGRLVSLLAWPLFALAVALDWSSRFGGRWLWAAGLLWLALVSV